MKILQVNFSDFANGGGGAIAMYRLCVGLKKIGLDCKILSGLKTLASDESQRINRSSHLEFNLKKITSRLGLNDIHCVSSFGLTQHDFYLEADIINFHVLHSSYFSYLAIPKLTAKKPAILTLHDMWGFTGHCAYSADCDRWKTGCGKCPYPQAYPPIRRDNTRLEWKLKEWVYRRSNLTIVTPSRWLATQAKASMLDRFPIYHIPNGIDTNACQPIDKQLCRTILGIPEDRRVLLFGAESLSDQRKGGDLLLKALQQLPRSLKAEMTLLTFGVGGEAISAESGMSALSLGYISSDRLKSMAYSAADLFVFPTREDNLPLVLQESMACGTPMVSFDVGGVPELVRHGETGYLAKPENVEDLCQSIETLMEDVALRHTMSENCRAIALREYSIELQVKHYAELYKQVSGSILA
jgi:glycosyltransferase involved in cell wall biosynthesis